MILVFRRTGQRRYAVEAQRAELPDVVMNPAPGYDPLLPHDMMHMVVEAQLGLTRAVFGQLAAGGDAGTFHLPFKPDERPRELARARTRVRARGKKLSREGRDEAARSERAAWICRHEWLARSQQQGQVRDTAGTAELGALNKSKLDEICEHLDELSSHWSSLEVGESMAVRWPDLEIVDTPALSR